MKSVIVKDAPTNFPSGVRRRAAMENREISRSAHDPKESSENDTDALSSWGEPLDVSM